MKILLISDPKTHPPFDTTVTIYSLLAASPAFEVYHAEPVDIVNHPDFPIRILPPSIDFETFNALSGLSPIAFSSARIDLAFCRSDKPYPTGYLNRLEELEIGGLKFVNSPQGLKWHLDPKNTFSLLAKHSASTILTNSAEEALRFLQENQEIVAKRPASYGGKGVYRIKECKSGYEVDNIIEGKKHLPEAESLFRELFDSSDAPFQLVRYLKTVSQGDKRILVNRGKILGAYLRKSSSGSWVQNITQGAEAFPADVTGRERNCIRQTEPHYRNRGLNTLGYDFLCDENGDWLLSEINAGNIGGYDRLDKLSNSDSLSKLLTLLSELSRG